MCVEDDDSRVASVICHLTCDDERMLFSGWYAECGDFCLSAIRFCRGVWWGK